MKTVSIIRPRFLVLFLPLGGKNILKNPRVCLNKSKLSNLNGKMHKKDVIKLVKLKERTK